MFPVVCRSTHRVDSSSRSSKESHFDPSGIQPDYSEARWCPDTGVHCKSWDMRDTTRPVNGCMWCGQDYGNTRAGVGKLRPGGWMWPTQSVPALSETDAAQRFLEKKPWTPRRVGTDFHGAGMASDWLSKPRRLCAEVNPVWPHGRRGQRVGSRSCGQRVMVL